MKPGKNGKWTETVIHSFNNNGKDGFTPEGGLVMDASGTLYGTTYGGGTHPTCEGEACGTVFQLKPDAKGKWVETLIHNFDANGIDGYEPEAGLTLDERGNLYGTTAYGGNGNAGTVFTLSPLANGEWAETIIHSFNLTDGALPATSVVFDSAGNLYGTTVVGGDLNCQNRGCGTIFELVAGTNGKWKEKVLRSFHTFISSPNDLLLDGSGNIFATTGVGGVHSGGTAYELAPGVKGKGRWKTLHNFGAAGDGDGPIGRLAFDANGNLYGVTGFGGINASGTIFEIKP